MTVKKKVNITTITYMGKDGKKHELNMPMGSRLTDPKKATYTATKGEGVYLYHNVRTYVYEMEFEDFKKYATVYEDTDSVNEWEE